MSDSRFTICTGCRVHPRRESLAQVPRATGRLRRGITNTIIATASDTGRNRAPADRIARYRNGRHHG